MIIVPRYIKITDSWVVNLSAVSSVYTHEISPSTDECRYRLYLHFIGVKEAQQISGTKERIEDIYRRICSLLNFD